MNRAEVAQLLGQIIAIDPRRKAVGESAQSVVDAWAPTLETVTYPAAQRAVSAHYRQTAEPILPAHIIRLVNAEHTAQTHHSEDGCSLGNRCRCTHSAPCEGGWITVIPGPVPTVKRCPNCLPAGGGR